MVECLAMAESELSSAEQEALSELKDAIALITRDGFWTYQRDRNGELMIARLNLSEQRIEVILKALDQLFPTGEHAHSSIEKAQEYESTLRLQRGDSLSGIRRTVRALLRVFLHGNGNVELEAQGERELAKEIMEWNLLRTLLSTMQLRRSGSQKVGSQDE